MNTQDNLDIMGIVTKSRTVTTLINEPQQESLECYLQEIQPELLTDDKENIIIMDLMRQSKLFTGCWSGQERGEQDRKIMELCEAQHDYNPDKHFTAKFDIETCGFYIRKM